MIAAESRLAALKLICRFGGPAKHLSRRAPEPSVTVLGSHYRIATALVAAPAKQRVEHDRVSVVALRSSVPVFLGWEKLTFVLAIEGLALPVRHPPFNLRCLWCLPHPNRTVLPGDGSVVGRYGALQIPRGGLNPTGAKFNWCLATTFVSSDTRFADGRIFFRRCRLAAAVLHTYPTALHYSSVLGHGVGGWQHEKKTS